MGSLAAEISLHCIICFEEFDVRDRPPVVLPCGHTYVCLVCAKRLRKCMECREPLYWTPPLGYHKVGNGLSNPTLNTRSPATLRYSRGRYSPGPQTPPHPNVATPPIKEEPIPLPLPKNTVLMGMIEAADRQARILRDAKDREESAAKPKQCKANDNGSGETDDDYEDEDEDDVVKTSKLDPILAGMSALIGTCGTYAVREPLGLAVLPFDPNKQHQLEGHFGSGHDGCDEEKKTDETREPFTIEEGQKVQVVSVDEGVYMLARGEGYIVASVNQLVKVGGPIETSCQYEGMLQSVLRKQDELQKELDEINGLVLGLQEKIVVQQALSADFPIITPPIVPHEDSLVNDENDVTLSAIPEPTTPTRPDQSPRLETAASMSSTEVNLGGNPTTPAQETPLQDRFMHSPAHSCPMPGTMLQHGLDHGLVHPFMDGHTAGLPRYRINNDDDINGLPWSFGCGTGLFGERLIEQDCDAGNVMTLSFDDSLVDGSIEAHYARTRNSTGRSLAARALGSAHMAHEDLSLRSGSFDGPINFRTGMSGHTGLSLSRKKQQANTSRPHVRMMSEHRGIAAGASARPHQPFPQRRAPGMSEHME